MCDTVQTRTHQESWLLCVCTCFVLSTLYIPSCARENTDVVFYRYDGYTFSDAERRTIQTIAENAVRDARVLLPNLPANLIIRVNPGTKVIDEIGSSSSHSTPNVIYWDVDPSRPGGAAGIARAHLRPTLFFHFHRLTRQTYQAEVTLMDHVIGFGMATAFERDAGGRTYPWGQYPAEVTAWVTELIALPATANLNHWMSHRHPDGRRWVGIRAGTYLVDQAISASGKSAAELVSLPSAEIIRLALKQ
jgi:predicted Zn-dependent protease DUF2268